jgi:hypothetical protein
LADLDAVLKEVKRVVESFRFTSVVQLQEMLGRRARDEQELLELLEEVPIDCIYHHTAARFLRFEVVDAMFPNDFAMWATREVRDQVLGERLGVIDPFDFPNLEALRQELVTTLDDHLARISVVPRVIHGEPFHFMRSRLIEIPSGHEARDIASFEKALSQVDTSSIYYHTVEARLRKGVLEGDFAKWLGDQPGGAQVSAKVARLSPFSSSLEAMRTHLLDLVRAAQGRPAISKEKAA